MVQHGFMLNTSGLRTWQQSNISHLHTIAAASDTFQPETQTPFTTELHHVLKVSNYSTLILLLITAYVLRFIFNLRHHKKQQTGPILATELDKARKLWISDSQKEVYWREATNLTSTSQNRLILGRQLRLILDKEGILHCWMLHPFTVTGGDFTGTLYVRQNSEEIKVIFICLHALPPELYK